MKLTSLLWIFAFMFVNTVINAQATLSMQGTIRSSTGSAIADDTYSLTFRLYTTETGGSPVWSETQSSVPVIGGVYSALLGAVNPLNAAFNVPYYVGVSVNGGSEMTPRLRLTSSPYALSLIGQGNTFPSSGTVGIGTASPDPFFTLQVGNNSDEGKMIVTAPAGKRATVWMRSGDKWTNIENNNNVLSINGGSLPLVLIGEGADRLKTNASGVDIPGTLGVGGNLNLTGNLNISGSLNLSSFSIADMTANKVRSQASTDLQLFRAGDLHVTLGSNQTSFSRQVGITGSSSTYLGGTHYAGVAGITNVNWGGYPANNYSIGLAVDARILTSGIHLYSDTRIKKDILKSDGHSDLSTLMDLQVVNYRYIDSLKSGSTPNKGFIAQQVEKVFPMAVRTATDVIPNIFDAPVSVEINGDKARFDLDKEHGLQAGDRVRIMLESKAEIFTVTDVNSDQSFTVGEWQAKGEKGRYFVYGKEVNDFKEVDYDRIHNLNVSATQELARQVAQLRAENAELLRMNEATNSRLAKLEALLDTGNSKR